MAKAKGFGSNPGRKQRGRTSITKLIEPSPTHPMVKQIANTEVNRVGGGKNMNKHRGDRRDMSPTYTGNEKHAARGNTPRRDVSTRAR